MNDATLVVGYQVPPSRAVRLGAVVAALAIVLAMFVVVQERADAAPQAAAAAAVAAAVGGGAGAAQIDFRQFICPILIAIRNAFAASPFFAFIQAIINQLLAQFGCLPSPG